MCTHNKFSPHRRTAPYVYIALPGGHATLCARASFSSSPLMSGDEFSAHGRATLFIGHRDRCPMEMELPGEWRWMDRRIIGEAARPPRAADTAEQLMWLVRWPLPLLVLVSPVGAPPQLGACLSFPEGSSSASRLRCVCCGGESDRSRRSLAAICSNEGTGGNMGVGGGVRLKLPSDEKIPSPANQMQMLAT